jgi:hypothetical protein
MFGMNVWKASYFLYMKGNELLSLVVGSRGRGFWIVSSSVYWSPLHPFLVFFILLLESDSKEEMTT